MSTIIFAFIAVFVFCTLGRNSRGAMKSRLGNGNAIIFCAGNSQLYWGLFILLAIIAGCRRGFVDTNAYKSMYEVIGRDFSMVTGENLRIEKGFRFICYILNHISSNSQFLVIVVSVFVTFAFFKFIDQYSIDRWFSAAVFFLTMYLTTMNTMRQYIVVGALLLCIPMLSKGKWWLFLLISFVLAMIHSTAIFAAVGIILSRGRVLSKRVVIIVVFMLVLAFTPAEQFLTLLQAASVQDYADMYESLNKSGINIMRMAVQAVPVLLGVIYFHLYGKENLDHDYAMFANLGIINLMVYILSMKSNYLARIAIYFEMFNLIMIPFFLTRIIKKDQVVIAKGIALFLYSIYFYYAVQGFGTASINMITPFFLGGY